MRGDVSTARTEQEDELKQALALQRFQQQLREQQSAFFFRTFISKKLLQMCFQLTEKGRMKKLHENWQKS